MSPLICFLSALVLSLLLTPLSRNLGLRARLLASSGAPDPIPVTGGLAILAALVGGAVVAALIDRSASLLPHLLNPGLVVGVFAVAVIGFLDDARPLRPWQKLAGQFLSAGLAVRFGLTVVVLGDPIADGVLVMLWLVWASNAFNVTDMMDGLAGGAGVLSAAGLACMGAMSGDTELLTVGSLTAGSLIGFLVYNSAPARIYMGDSGSLPLGLLLGGLALTAMGPSTEWSMLTVPPLLLGVVTFEALFLTVIRTARRVPVMRASPDHTAHRLRLMGLSTRETVALLWLAHGVLVVAALLVYLKGLAWIPLVALPIAVVAGGFLATVNVELDAGGVSVRGRGWFTRNWAVHRVLWETMARATSQARGRLLDVGCGRQPYGDLFGPHVLRTVAVDRDRTRYDTSAVDGWCDAQRLPFSAETFDTVLSNQMLEHVPRPQEVVSEMARVLRPGGRLILTAPHIWGVHEVPHDYYRFTPFGLRHLAEEAGLSDVEVRAMAGFWMTAGARFCYYLSRFERGPLSLPIRLLYLPLQAAALLLDSIHRVEEDAWNHVLIAGKPDGVEVRSET